MKTKFQIVIDTTGSQPPSNEQRMEMLAYVRNVVSNFTHNFPETNLTVLNEVSNEEVIEAIRSDSQTIETCLYYDEAQGRHKCNNDLVKSTKCRGVCKDYKDKR